MEKTASDLVARQLLTVSELERLDRNQRAHDVDITNIGKDLAVLKMQVRLLLWAGGFLSTSAIGVLISRLL